VVIDLREIDGVDVSGNTNHLPYLFARLKLLADRILARPKMPSRGLADNDVVRNRGSALVESCPPYDWNFEELEIVWRDKGVVNRQSLVLALQRDSGSVATVTQRDGIDETHFQAISG